MINCNKTTACSDSDMNTTTASGRGATNNPRFRLYAWGPVNDLDPDRPRSTRRSTSRCGLPTTPRRPTTTRSIDGGRRARWRRRHDEPRRRRPHAARRGLRARRRAPRHRDHDRHAPTDRSSNAATPASAARTSRTAAHARRRCRHPGAGLTRSAMSSAAGSRASSRSRTAIMTKHTPSPFPSRVAPAHGCACFGLLADAWRRRRRQAAEAQLDPLLLLKRIAAEHHDVAAVPAPTCWSPSTRRRACSTTPTATTTIRPTTSAATCGTRRSASPRQRHARTAACIRALQCSAAAPPKFNATTISIVGDASATPVHALLREDPAGRGQAGARSRRCARTRRRPGSACSRCARAAPRRSSSPATTAPC